MAGRRAKLQGEVTCLIVDDLHLLYDPHGGSRHEHWCNVSRVLKAMAFELQLPVVAFLRLDLPEPAKTHCGLDALCDFGSIAQDADIILLLAKSDHVNASGPTHGTMDHVHVSVAKNRHGQTGLMKLGLNAPTGALTSWSAGTNTLWATEFKEQ
jgi:replicative DNA helicase